MRYIVSSFRFFLVTLLFIVFGSWFQQARAQGPGNGGPQPGATNAPIDGGISLLLAAGAGYGLRRLTKRAPSQ